MFSFRSAINESLLLNAFREAITYIIHVYDLDDEYISLVCGVWQCVDNTIAAQI